MRTPTPTGFKEPIGHKPASSITIAELDKAFGRCAEPAFPQQDEQRPSAVEWCVQMEGTVPAVVVDVTRMIAAITGPAPRTSHGVVPGRQRHHGCGS